MAKPSTSLPALSRQNASLYVDLHVQAEPSLSLHDAHILSGRVKSAIRQRVPTAVGVLIHMEPYEPAEASLIRNTNGSARSRL